MTSRTYKKNRAPINHDDSDDSNEDTDDDAEDDARHDQEIGGKRIMTSVSPTSRPNPNSLNYKTKDPDKCKTTIRTNAFLAGRIFRFSGLPFFRHIGSIRGCS